MKRFLLSIVLMLYVVTAFSQGAPGSPKQLPDTIIITKAEFTQMIQHKPGDAVKFHHKGKEINGKMDYKKAGKVGEVSHYRFALTDYAPGTICYIGIAEDGHYTGHIKNEKLNQWLKLSLATDNEFIFIKSESLKLE